MRRLTGSDEYIHEVGTESNWNESRYVDFWDSAGGVGGWLRLGVRPNEKHAEVSTCFHLPDGTLACMFDRPHIEGNVLHAAGQSWLVGEPYRFSHVRYSGEMLLLPDPWLLTNPKAAFATAERVPVELELLVETLGLAAVMGSDQSHIDRIFLPGQADWHYQHLAWSTGTLRVGGDVYEVDGSGGKDHSWGPRNWLAKEYLRWLTATIDGTRDGFMLMRAVGPSKRTRSGHVYVDGEFHLVDDFEIHNTYAGPPHYELLRTAVSIQANGRTWSAVGQALRWVPLRHRGKDAAGGAVRLRIVKSPMRWTFDDGRTGGGASEFHDVMVGDEPIGLLD